MHIGLAVILFVVFAMAQLLCTQKVAHRVIKYIPMLVSAFGGVLAIVVYIYTLITYNMGVVSESVLAENQYFSTFILIPVGICLVGSVVGLLIAKKVK